MRDEREQKIHKRKGKEREKKMKGKDQYLKEEYFFVAEEMRVGPTVEAAAAGQASFSESARRTLSKRDMFLW